MTLAPPRPELSDLLIRALFEEARRRRRRRWAAGSIFAATLALVVGMLVSLSQPTARARGSALSQRTKPVGPFAHPTGVVLVFADGLTLDLDHRLVVARTIPGQRAGDQRWDIIRSGDSLVVGWGGVWADPIGGGPPRLLGPVVTSVPAAEPGAVWLVDYPGGRIGEGTPTLREVTVTGSVLRTELGPPPSSGVPVVGIPEGLAFESRTGIALWSADRDAFTRRIGNEAGFIGNASGGYIAWCEGICRSLHLTVIDGSDHVVPSPQAGSVVEPESLRLSPDGRYVAVITTRAGLGTANQRGTLDVIDTRTGRVDVVRRHLSAWSTLTWRPDARAVFFASDNSSGMTVGEFQVGTRHEESAEIPTENAEQFVIVTRPQATGLLRGAVREPMSDCRASVLTPNPSGACAATY